MDLQALFFYLFSFMTIGSASMVIVVRNPVYSVFFLILTFLNAAGLFLLLGAEFIAMIILVVYIGAVAVLFLFVVMMLDIDFEVMRTAFIRRALLGIFVVGVLVTELILGISDYSVFPNANNISTLSVPNRSNTGVLGDTLYTDYIYFFK